MGCIFLGRLNSLWSVWYTILVLLLNIYLIYLGFERYLLYTEIKWPHGAYPHVWTTVYMSLYGTCCGLCLLFFAFGVFKSGNLAGDNDHIGVRTERTLETTHSLRKSCCLRFFKTSLLHAPSLPQVIHIKLALFQMFAQQVMLAQLYRFGFINSGDFLNTELDFIFQRARQLATNLPMGDTRLQGFRITTEELTGSPLAPNLLPILMHARLFGIPLEFVNLVIALIAFACSYPAVFWRVNKYLSFWFSTYLMLMAAEIIFAYLEFCILFRIQETNYYNVRPIGLGQHLSDSYVPKVLFHPTVIIAIFFTSVIILITGPIIIYYYGYQKYSIALKFIQNKNKERARLMHANEYGQIKHIEDPAQDLCCNGYGPSAACIVYLVLLALIRLPTIAGIVELYEHDQKPFLFTCIIIDATYLFAWIVYWIIFTSKGHWDMKILHTVDELLNLQDAHKLGFGTIAGKAPSELKNALIMMVDDHMYVTDDPLAKQSLMRHALKTTTHDEVYYLKGQQGSPIEKRVIIEENKEMMETMRLLEARRQSANNALPPGLHSPIMTYQQRAMRGLPPQPPSVNMPDDRFGTFQRQHYAPGMLNHQVATLGRHSSQNLRHPESYASINRSVKLVETNMSGNVGHGQMETSSNAQYASYSRMPLNRGPPPPQSILSNCHGIYEARQSSEPVQRIASNSPMGSVKASPLLNDKKEISHYQRTSALSSFNNGNRTSVNSAPRLLPTGQSQWNPQQKQTISASSSQQDSCYTPTSTTTQNGSSNQSTKQHTPTGQNGTRLNGFGTGHEFEVRSGSEPYQATGTYGTLNRNQINTGSAPRITSGPVRMPIKSTTVSITRHHDDSANFSLSSSNDSDGKKLISNIHDPEYATSVV